MAKFKAIELDTGDSGPISLFTLAAGILPVLTVAPPWLPSREDEQFCLDALKQLVAKGFVLAADADRYEEIVAAHSKWAEGMPARVRDSEARRFKAMRDGRELKSALAKKRR